MQEQDKLRSRPRGRFERLNVVIAILIAGWVPSILMLVVSYTILTKTLESKIQRDRQSFVQLIAHLVGDDLARSGEIVAFYQTYPPVAKIFTARYPDVAAKKWLQETYFSHPRIDGMFITTADGRLIASIPPDDPARMLDDRISKIVAGRRAHGTRRSTSRQCTRARRTTGSPPISLVQFGDRMGRRSDSSVSRSWSNASAVVFPRSISPTRRSARLSIRTVPRFSAMISKRIRIPISDSTKALISDIRSDKSGHIEQRGKLYSSAPVEPTGWITFVEQPRSVAYRPVRDLLERMTVLATWLIVATGIIAWLAGKYYRRQREAAARIEREVIFNDKILANMPSGIALVDPETRRFLQANEAFEQMARRFGNLPPEKEMRDATYQDVSIAPAEAIEKVLSFGTPFQLVEQPLVDRAGITNFVNVNLLRLQDSKQTVQGVLFLVEDKTRDVRLRQELILANAAKDQFLALLSHELRNPLSPVIAMVGELEARSSDDPEVRQPLAVIRRNVELEARLIDDLLDVTRIAKGKLQLSLEVTSIHETLAARLRNLSRGHSAKESRV